MLQEPGQIEDDAIEVTAQDDGEARRKGEQIALLRSDAETVVKCLGCHKRTRTAGKYICTLRREARSYQQETPPMQETFNPIKGNRGEFRVSINLTELGERAWNILALSQQLGFEKPRFITHARHSGAVEVWGVILQQFHAYRADTRGIVDKWDEPLDQLRQAIGAEDEFSLMVLYNFAEYLELAESLA